MLIKKVGKTVYPYAKNGTFHLNFPKEAYERFGSFYIMEIHDDKVVMIPCATADKDTKVGE